MTTKQSVGVRRGDILVGSRVSLAPTIRKVKGIKNPIKDKLKGVSSTTINAPDLLLKELKSILPTGYMNNVVVYLMSDFVRRNQNGETFIFDSDLIKKYLPQLK